MMCSATVAYLGIGSNIGDRRANLDRSIELLKSSDGIEVRKVSPFYNTAPVGYLEQPDFLNGVVEIETTLTPHELLKVCGSVEENLKRIRVTRWGPRTIDVDILLFGDSIVSADDLVIPHPRMHEREFVLKPLNDIAPDAVHTVLKMTVSELFRRLSE